MKHIKLLYPVFLAMAIAVFLGFASKQNDSAVNLIVKLDNVEAGPMTSSQLANVNTVTACVINATDGTPINYSVNSFTLAITQVRGAKGGTKYSEDATGNLLSRTMKAKIATLQPGDIVIIKNIKATSPQNVSVSYGITSWQIVANPVSNGK